MTEEINEQEVIVKEPPKMLFDAPRISTFATFVPNRRDVLVNAWTDEDKVDKYDINSIADYRNAVRLSRYYYMHDPIASTVINKLIDIGITDIKFFNNGLSDNELKLFEGIAPNLRYFIEECALEFLTTGMVIPEITMGAVRKNVLESFGIKRLNSAILPIDMWVRDSGSIKINKPMISGKSSYFTEIPQEFVEFVQQRGKYADGTEDKKLYEYLLQAYPKFILQVRNLKATIEGKFYILLDNPQVITSKKTANSIYPIPYTYPVLESLKHKRNMRRMDYSITSRVISAIQLVKVGNDMYPVTEEDESQLDEIKDQMYWRYSREENIERVFQLFANHTVEIEWIFPDTQALLDDTRYNDINQDILFGFGFPRILLTGESQRTGTSDPEYAMISPVKTMESMRRKMYDILETIVDNMVKMNGFTSKPKFEFDPMNIHDFLKFFDALSTLYESGNLSREEYAEALGYNIETELQKRKEENSLLKKYGLEEFAPMPHSNSPTQGGNQQQNQPKKTNNQQK